MKIGVVGCLGIDTNVYFYGDGPNFELEGNFTHNCDYFGQSGGYVTRLFKSMGYEPVVIAPLGEDYHGDYIRQIFVDNGISASGLFVDPKGTNRSVNFMYADGRRKNFYDGKGNFDLILPPSLDLSILNQTSGVHFSIANWCRELLPYCKQNNIPISVDLQDVVDWKDEYRHDFIEAADIIFFSMTNFHGKERIIMEWLKDHYPHKIFVAGNGSKGCWSYDGKDIHSYPATNDHRHPVVDTNGAGDSLACGVLHVLWGKGGSLAEACAAGQRLARYVCTIKASTDFCQKEVLAAISHDPHR